MNRLPIFHTVHHFEKLNSLVANYSLNIAFKMVDFKYFLFMHTPGKRKWVKPKMAKY